LRPASRADPFPRAGSRVLRDFRKPVLREHGTKTHFRMPMGRIEAWMDEPARWSPGSGERLGARVMRIIEGHGNGG
jgi:hypothetical protein